MYESYAPYASGKPSTEAFNQRSFMSICKAMQSGQRVRVYDEGDKMPFIGEILGVRTEGAKPHWILSLRCTEGDREVYVVAH